MNEKEIRLDFFQKSMKLFEKLRPNFCLIDFCNSHVQSSSSDLDLEFLLVHIVSILEFKIKLKDSDIRQLIHDLRIVLDHSPSSRLFIIGAITDFCSIRFVKVIRSNSNDQFQYMASRYFFISSSTWSNNIDRKFVEQNC